MTRAEIFTMLKSVGIPTAYHHFAENTGIQPPFICFYCPDDNDFLADNTNYVKVDALTVELYTDNKDFELEGRLEAALNGAGLVYTRFGEYIDSEKMYMQTYETEVLIDG